VLAACQAVRDKVLDLARGDPRLAWRDAPASALRLENGVVHGPGGSVPVAALLARSGQDAIEASAGASLDDRAKQYSRHAFGSQFAEVLVDPDLGTIRVSRWVAAFDGGQILNSKTAHSQLIGGITFGIGMALLEETHVDGETGRIVNANVAEYLVPVNADVPDIQAFFVPNDEHNSNPLGVKGIGELPTVGVAAAIANAVYHATGVRVRKLPIRIEDVLDA
jgi:xanthine dehydrogenase YagR molybdenum-binding subunit